MSIPDKDHPLWKIIPAALAVVVLGLMMSFNYANGFDMWKDTETILATIVAYLTGSAARAVAPPAA